MNIIAEITLGALASAKNESLPHYASVLQQVCDTNPPPFGMAWYGDKFRTLARNPTWVARGLLINAQKEFEGACDLLRMTQRLSDSKIAELVRAHAKDEFRHARMYVTLLDLVFPNALANDAPDRRQVMQKSDWGIPTDCEKTPEEDAFDELFQINLAEIRTRTNQLLMRPVLLAYCSDAKRDKVRNLADALLNDETRHITYTGRLLNHAWSQRQARRIKARANERLVELNRITLYEVCEGACEETFVGH